MSIKLTSILWKVDLGTPNRKLVAIRLADFADDEGRGIWPSVGLLVHETHLSERTVQRILKDLVEDELLRKRRQGGGRKSTLYDINMERVRVLAREAEQRRQAAEAERRSGGENKLNEGCHRRISAEGDGASEASECHLRGGTTTPQGRHGGTQSIIEPLMEPLSIHQSEREAHENGEGEGGKEEQLLFDRVRRMEQGAEGSSKWFGAETSSTKWAVQQFAELTEEERRLAEERRDAFLACCPKDKNGNPTPCSLGIYFRDKKFLGVASDTVQARPSGEKVAVIPFGSIWAGKRMLALLDGPEPVVLPDDLHDWARKTFEILRGRNTSLADSYRKRRGIQLDAKSSLVFPDDFVETEKRRWIREEGFPEAKRLDSLAKGYDREMAEGRFRALIGLCEPVPVGSALYLKWQDYHEAKGWPFVPDPPEHIPLVYFPRGGPEALEEFEVAARTAVGLGEREVPCKNDRSECRVVTEAELPVTIARRLNCHSSPRHEKPK
ncbi:helix-turn-helix domain-containing protein [Sinorhizobium fredii]|uniref:helix-turn-helix domain-containing protein n=1 Tax=Rhizobium fredii TaxID=380 RepID=UPI0004B0D2F3|nr:helix-turn-helix domain-containing protein [Sinorhizobium fredii]AWM23722.1 hypothetical protein AOX55_0000442 [Sinorhizobium fredii CCBAU 25509]